MLLPALLLLAMGTIGAVDALWYHLYKLRLAQQPGSRAETVTHIVRSLTFAVALTALVQGRPSGGWFWALAAVFALDFADDVADVLIEPKSRAPLGGLPPREYLVHMVVMGLSGATWLAYVVQGWALRAGPTALLPASLPAWLVWDARLTAAGALLLGCVDLVLLLRSSDVVEKRELGRT